MKKEVIRLKIVMKADLSLLSSSSRACLRVRGRRRGISMWLFVFTLPIILGTCGLVIDLGQLHARRAQAQRAADAAALAGAQVSGADNSNVVPKALHYAEINGFSAARGDQVIVTTNYESATLGNAAAINTVRVQIKHPERVFFAPAMEGMMKVLGWSNGAAQFSRVVGTKAAARKFVYLPMSTGGNYGIASGQDGFITNIINGPFARYNDADPWSTRYLMDGSPNPRYTETNGYSNYTLKIPDDWRTKFPDGKAYLQIYDPDSRNATPNEFDLYVGRNTNITDPPPVDPLVKTKYEILKIDNSGNLSPIASAIYGGTSDADIAANLKWVTPDGFAIDLNTWGAGDYRVRVSSVDGWTCNDYALRAGPVGGLGMDENTWNNTYGDKLGTAPSNVYAPMQADGRLMIGFRSNGTAQLKLGYLGPEFAGRTVTVSHFDLDINSQSVNYVVDSLPGVTFPGVIPPEPDGKWSSDTITLPSDFKGGNLAAQYAAGISSAGYDGSSWELYGEGTGDGFVRLIE
ncbi:hypothetical protein EON83_15530 [bacterium]|nr:MAG: hypothetical protein EON83_15530 [bacterium]